MDLAEPLQVVILWAHAMAAVAWVGGSLFFAIALNPAVEQLGPTPDRVTLVAAAGREFREVVRLSIVIFVVTGVVLAFTRLGNARVTTGYVAVLAFKSALSLWMFWLAGRVGQSAGLGRWWLRPQYLILELGTVVYLLSLVLRVLYEQTLAPIV